MKIQTQINKQFVVKLGACDIQILNIKNISTWHKNKTIKTITYWTKKKYVVQQRKGYQIDNIYEVVKVDLCYNEMSTVKLDSQATSDVTHLLVK